MRRSVWAGSSSRYIAPAGAVVAVLALFAMLYGRNDDVGGSPRLRLWVFWEFSINHSPGLESGQSTSCQFSSKNPALSKGPEPTKLLLSKTT